MSKKTIMSQIAHLMTENVASHIPSISQVPQSLMTFNQYPGGQYDDNEQHEEEEFDDEFDEEEFRIARQFIEIIGCPERARELLDKAIECSECLGMDKENNDANTIETVAAIMPDSPDMPTNGALVSQFYSANSPQAF